MNEFWEGFKKGAKETPIGYFAPIIVLVRLIVTMTDSVLRRESHSAH